jgi:arylsulfatase A-like enzyme
MIVLDDLGTDKLAFYTPELEPGSPQPACGAVPPPGEKAYPCTPTLESLRSQGVLFTNAYTHPSCTPTRASILTGRYPFRTGMGVAIDDSLTCGDETGVPCDGPQAMSDDELLLSELLRDAPEASEYQIARGAFGKWHLTYVIGDECHPIRNGFEVFQGNMGNGNISATGPDHFKWNYTSAEDDGDGGCDLFVEQTADIRTCGADNTWDAAVTRRRARRWINSQVARRRPYFAYVAFNPPHGTQQVPPLCDLSQETQDYLATFGLAATGAKVSSSTIGTAEERRLAIFNATVEGIDTEIARLLRGLGDAMVIVVGDNGTPGRIIDAPPAEYPSCRGKRTPYQLGVRVPLIVKGPLIPIENRGSTATRLVDTVDLYRTTANLLGVTEREIDAYIANRPQPPTLDSKSFLPLLLDSQGAGRRGLSYTEVYYPNSGGVAPFEPVTWLRTVTDGEYKLVRKVFDMTWSAGQPMGGRVVEEMFHLTTDPWEVDPICAPLPDPAECGSACPPPACYAPSNPSCGDPVCQDPSACCGVPCPPPLGHPARLAYVGLRRYMETVSAGR